MTFSNTIILDISQQHRRFNVKSKKSKSAQIEVNTVLLNCPEMPYINFVEQKNCL